MPPSERSSVADRQLRSIPGKDYEKEEAELDGDFPNRPKNTGSPLLFYTIYEDLFEPLLENSKSKVTGPQLSRKQLGPKAQNSRSPHEVRRAIIERYFSRWRKEVGYDLFPIIRLIVPEKDRHRSMYGIKEKALAKYLIKILKIDKNSDDGYNLVNWKHMGRGTSGQKAGDFPSRCYEVLEKRPFRTKPGDLTIDDVNRVLDTLSVHGKEEEQVAIIEHFYRHMNPKELKWLLCIILRTGMHVGASEKTFFSVFHEDAETLFNICSDLRRVCFDLWSPNIRLEKEDRGIVLEQCFQPQLANYGLKNMKLLLSKMQVTEENPDFWIEEKLDGERMQMHMWKDATAEGGMKFKFFSRKAKDYTYLYGKTLKDPESALTVHIADAFDEAVENIILDGEMITWDVETDKMVPFGTLKTAALAQQKNPFSDGIRPLFRVFDILYLNDSNLTLYELRERRKALARSIKPVPRRLEILEYKVGRTLEEVEDALRRVVAEASEGLVVKNPRSSYRLNDRNDDWIKVKPEYMEEFGESLDCLVIGGYYGSGKRGGGIASFLCGLRADSKDSDPSKPCKFLSFFKVGGGFTASDYKEIMHHTADKWHDYNRASPPIEYVELGGGVQYQRERPDVWIKPPDSVVLQVKAASVMVSDQYASNLTLRFPRFTRLRLDKDWTTALSYEDFLEVRSAAETAVQEKQEFAKRKDGNITLEQRKRHQRVDVRKKTLQVAGYAPRTLNAALTRSKSSQSQTTDPTTVLSGLTFYVLTESTDPKRSKIEIEELIKLNGGTVVQTADPPPSSITTRPDTSRPSEVVCIACRRTVKAASIIKRRDIAVLKPAWIFDTITQAQLDRDEGVDALPLRPEMARHVFYAPDERVQMYEAETDQFGDSYARDTSVEELRKIMKDMKTERERDEDLDGVKHLVGELPGWVFAECVICFADLSGDEDDDDEDIEISGTEQRNGDAKEDSLGMALRAAKNLAVFAGAEVVSDADAEGATHVVVDYGGADEKMAARRLKRLRSELASSRKKLPRIVTVDWVRDSWREKTRLDEERYAAV